MSIQLEPGFSGTIKVVNPEGKTFYQKGLYNKEEVTDFLIRYEDSKVPWGHFKRAVCPLYRGSIKNLLLDVTFPTLVNSALKVESVFIRILDSLLAICFDLATLPIRIIATPLSLIFLKKDTPHPLVKKLEAEGFQIDEDWVTINYSTENTEIDCRKNHATKEETNGMVRIALKTLPYDVYRKKGDRSTSSYSHVKGSWEREII